MEKYRIYYTDKAAQRRQATIDIIYGYSEDDALMRYGIDRSEIVSIKRTYY